MQLGETHECTVEQMSRVYSRLTTNMRLYADFFVLQEQGKTEKKERQQRKRKKMTREETGPAPALP